jgi:large subunit ribosomal protein L21
MYAILQHGGHQYRLSAGDHVVVDRLAAEVGDVVALEPVLLLSDGDGVRHTPGELEGVRVAATVVAHRRGRKLRVFTYKPKKRHRRTLGFRAELTELVVHGVLARGEPMPGRETAEAPVAPEPEAPSEEVPARARRRARGPRAGAASAPAAETEPETPAEAEPETPAEAAAPEAPSEVAPRTPQRRRQARTPAPPEAASGEGEGAPEARPRRAARQGRTEVTAETGDPAAEAGEAAAGPGPGTVGAAKEPPRPRTRRRSAPPAEESE